MRPETAVATVVVLVVLVGLVVVGLGGDLGPGGGDLAERWASDTPRDNTVNHHAVGVGPDGVVVAPVTAVHGAEEITATSCSLVRLAPDSGDVAWRYSVPPDACFSHALTAPAIADVDGDGRREVAVATTEDALVVLDAATGEEAFRVPLSTYGYARPAVGDLTDDPGPELVVSDIGGGVVAVAGDGGVLWRRPLDASVLAPPFVGDVTGDGDAEVLVATGNGTVLLSAAGDVEWRAPGRATTMSVGQVDDDPAREVFVTDTRTVTALDGATGEVAWERTEDARARVGAVADGDGDGRAELYVGLVSQHVVALDAATGERAWATRLAPEARPTMPAPVVGDVGGDDGPEVVAAASDGTVVVLDPDTGEERAAYERRVPVWTLPTLADLDGDGDAEILVRYGDGRVVALDYDA